MSKKIFIIFVNNLNGARLLLFHYRMLNFISIVINDTIIFISLVDENIAIALIFGGVMDRQIMII